MENVAFWKWAHEVFKKPGHYVVMTGLLVLTHSMYRRLIYLIFPPHRNAHWGFSSSGMWFPTPKYTYCTHFKYRCTIFQNTVTLSRSDFLSGYRSTFQVNFWKTHTHTHTCTHTHTHVHTHTHTHTYTHTQGYTIHSAIHYQYAKWIYFSNF